MYNSEFKPGPNLVLFGYSLSLLSQSLSLQNTFIYEVIIAKRWII